jgi:RNA polymerase sigma-70 factor (ECF subfamily)
VEQAERRFLNEELTRLADGDREAFHPVFVALRPILRRFAARHCRPEDAEDVAQETLLKVFVGASEFDPGRDALSWVLGIAAYEVRTARRRRQRRREDDLEPSVLATRDRSRSPEDLSIGADLDAALEAALSDMAPVDRRTLEAFALGERPADVPAATFRKRVERGLVRLRRLWERRHGGR